MTICLFAFIGFQFAGYSVESLVERLIGAQVNILLTAGVIVVVLV